MPDGGEHGSYEPCPSCGQQIPIHRGFQKWCAACEWNLVTDAQEPPRGTLGQIYRHIGRKNARQLFETYVNAPESALRPRNTIATLTAIIFVLGVHLISLIIGVTGIYLIVTGWPKIFPIVLGCLLLGVFWLLLPRFGRLPDDVLEESEFPMLFDLVSEICDGLGVERVHHIVIDEQFNASIEIRGLRAVPLLNIGLPLWKILNDRQRVALLSHEMSHRANGDPARGTLTYTALHTLYQWHGILVQEHYDRSGIGELIAEAIMRLLAVVVELIILVFSHLLWRDSQKAEYLADYLATTVCGTQAMIGVLDQIRVGADSLSSILNNSVTSVSQSGAELLEKTSKAVESIPEHERERIRRGDRTTQGSLDDTHPPTEFRIQFLEHHPIEKADILLSDERAAGITVEMATLEEKIGKKLVYAVLREA